MLRGRSYAIVADERGPCREIQEPGLPRGRRCSNFVQMLRPDDADVIER
ncbi:unnamed protein product [Fusarium graminearum]|nr:unnamed protein product [Fusarium graminearum]